MLPGEPSRTMLRSAIRRAAHQILDNPLILVDPIVVDLVPEACEPAIRDTLDEPGAPDSKLFRCMFAMRSRFAEDRLAQAVARGARQYVMVGAGLDTFPWRQPHFANAIKIFAADHPSSLAWTKGRLRQHGLSTPSNLTYVPADLEERRLGDQLIKSGFQREAVSFCSVLGVTQYLDRESIDALFRFAAKLPKSSEIVFSFAPPHHPLDVEGGEAFTGFGRRPALLGEPWKSRLAACGLVAQLTGLGFSDIFHLTPELARQRYFADQQELGAAVRWDHLIAAII
jgi:methyltransferase (TIGR00027 family)